MHRSLELAARARGRTSPNPLVGAVLVREGRVVGEGFHAQAGSPHAEAEALRAAGFRAAGATLYINLEPCAHQGRTPPCAAALVDAGVARVVSSLEDPDPRVAGRGHRFLRDAGIQVQEGFLADEAVRLNEEYLHRARTGRAFGVLKAAVTLDGRLGPEDGNSRWITGEESRRRAHEMRDQYDAVLVGRGTLERDDPGLDVRIPGSRRNPVAVVVDSKLSVPPDRSLWERAKCGEQVLMATTDSADKAAESRLVDCGVTVLRLPADPEGRVDMGSLFRALGGRGINSVMVEGGMELHTAVLRAGLIGRAHLFVAPLILGGSRGPRLVGDLGIGSVAEALRLREITHETLGSDVLITGRILPEETG
ncbi:MAG: bifunctional diaminohydroxyphosphoribosylaminopyrimidine deaminase/5-amino-6-(5-phosphoribosylamino)uracil reductase RibD [Gemmatimonadota bacterium]|jgi:diaminohydroxyphosphoribosylaminopyrimidine deaminase/5-amino-6-(5-phosphoribosylamino)uracil reductase|nr:bifunctional diaminohydroxyphosphoribosylaminopyrimidine deaminase/5-amino-6-(5-phosphoribosylamino)uracil reductase RibD [Gemmatimonadota bacterium]